jgi:hypothetical protein
VKNICLKILILTIALAATGATLQAQSKKKPAPKTQNQTAKKPVKEPELVVLARQTMSDYKVVLDNSEQNAKRAAEEVKKWKEFQTSNTSSMFYSKLELKQKVDESEKALAKAQADVKEAGLRIKEAESAIVEVRAAAQLAKLPAMRRGGYQVSATMIRFNGVGNWALANAAQVQSFFASRFGRALPISAFGQSAVHNQLGFDHRNSIDVAVHPDTAEGQALMAYLRGAGIPFIAFRGAVPGSATGAHLHIGYPSRRIR